jgi:hypothetical protein
MSNYFDKLISPHYVPEDFELLKSKQIETGKEIVALTNEQAILVNGLGVQIVGDGRIELNSPFMKG